MIKKCTIFGLGGSRSIPKLHITSGMVVHPPENTQCKKKQGEPYE